MRITDVLTGAEHSFQGALAENYVAQQLAARGREQFYWTSTNQAEVDFLIQDQRGISAIEVKSGANTRSRSLTRFRERYQPERAIRISTLNFGYRPELMAVPLYAAFCL